MLKAKHVLDFWFGEIGKNGEVDEHHSNRWWKKDPEFDQRISKTFGELHESAIKGQLDDWSKRPNDCLALIILLDQFSRNIHRDKKMAFAQDPHALDIAEDAVEHSLDLKLLPIQRVFLYMPFEHAENKDAQRRSILLFKKLADEVPRRDKKNYHFFLDFAYRHKEIIDQFGRFPHRNKILGRESTPEEIEFLKRPGSSF